MCNVSRPHRQSFLQEILSLAFLIVCLPLLAGAEEPGTNDCLGEVTVLLKGPARVPKETGHVSVRFWLTATDNRKELLGSFPDLDVGALMKEDKLLPLCRVPCADYTGIEASFAESTSPGKSQVVPFRLRLAKGGRFLLRITLEAGKEGTFGFTADHGEGGTSSPVALAVSQDPPSLCLIDRQNLELLDVVPLDARPDDVRVDEKRQLGVVLCSRDRKIILVDLRTFQIRGTLDIPIDGISSFGLEPETGLLCIGGEMTGQVAVLNVEGAQGASVIALEGRPGEIEAAKLGMFLALDKDNPGVFLIDGDKGVLYRKVSLQNRKEMVRFNEETGEAILASTYQAHVEYRTWPAFEPSATCSVGSGIQDLVFGPLGRVFLLTGTSNLSLASLLKDSCQAHDLGSTEIIKGRESFDPRFNLVYILDTGTPRLVTFDGSSGKARGSLPLPSKTVAFSVGARR